MALVSDREDSRLARRLGTGDAVFIGLSSMIGAGIFAAVAPAAAAAGRAVLVGLLVAAGVAALNATSVAQLARLYPESGGTYAYGRHRLGAFWGFLAGWAFVSGKLASCAAMALTFGSHAVPHSVVGQRLLAVLAVVAITALNLRGVDKTARAARWIVVVVLLSLATAVFAALAGPEADVRRAMPSLDAMRTRGVLEAAGFLFFAFAGYARIATLGEEVRDPMRTIPAAMAAALGVTILAYALVVVATVAVLDVPTVAGAGAPLALAVERGAHPWLAIVVRLGAVVASLGVLLSLLAGVSRTAFAMGANRDLPGWLAAVHPRSRVPHRAELGAGVLVAAAAALIDLRSAIGFSSFGVLLYYAIANACAWTLHGSERLARKMLAGLGVAGCLAIAFTLPWPTVVAGAGVVSIGATTWLRRPRGRPRCLQPRGGP